MSLLFRYEGNHVVVPRAQLVLIFLTFEKDRPRFGRRRRLLRNLPSLYQKRAPSSPVVDLHIMSLRRFRRLVLRGKTGLGNDAASNELAL